MQQLAQDILLQKEHRNREIDIVSLYTVESLLAMNVDCVILLA